MFKKTLITTAIFTACANMAFADAAPYVGAKLGLHSTTGSLKTQAGEKITAKSGRGIDGGIFAGFGADIDQHFYLGGEIFADAQRSHSSKKNVDAGTKLVTVQSKYSYGASVIPGVKFGQSSMVYGRVGVVRSRFDVKEQTTANSRSAGRNATGGQIGVGVQTDVSKNVGVRAEFVHTAYKNFKAFDNTFSLKDNQVNFGVFYKFD